VGVRAHFFDHVEFPDDIGIRGSCEFFVFVRAIVFSIAESLGIEADHFAAVSDIIEPVTLH